MRRHPQKAVDALQAKADEFGLAGRVIWEAHGPRYSWLPEHREGGPAWLGRNRADAMRSIVEIGERK